MVKRLLKLEETAGCQLPYVLRARRMVGYHCTLASVDLRNIGGFNSYSATKQQPCDPSRRYKRFKIRGINCAKSAAMSMGIHTVITTLSAC
jgi:hypothetical protein